MSTIALLALAFSLGVVHALDADHILTVSTLASHQTSWRQTAGYAMHWALGHGATILGVGGLVLLLGMAIPTHLSQGMEEVVGAIIIFLGLHVWWDLRKKEAHFHYHVHDGMPAHAHWHSHQQVKNHANHHRPLMIGMLHGIAGSSPLLAMLPASQLASPWLGMLYLVLFSLGVLLAMLAFGGCLGQAFWHLNQRGWMRATRFTVGALAVMVGARMLLFA